MHAKNNLREEADIFQCGRCKTQFTSFTAFTAHKSSHFEKDRGTSNAKYVVRPSIGNDIDYEHETSGENQSKFSSEVFTPSLTAAMRTSVNESESSNVVLHKSQIKHRCTFCSKGFTKNFDLQQHMRSHTGEKPFQCVICGRAFAQKSNAKKHMATHRVWPNRLCSINNSSTVNLPREMLSNKCEWSIDLQMNSHHCNFCGESFQSNLKLTSHMKNHDDRKVYICLHKDCRKTFEELENFLTHIEVHDHQLEYSCNTCYEVFDSLSSLGCHQLTHSSDDKSDNLNRCLQCPKCSMKFSSLESLNHHLDLNSHHYPCSRCPKICKSEKMLKLHIKIHDLKPYQCNVCSKILKGASSLKVHLITHTDSRPFQCEVCLMTFNRSDRLKRHKLIHQCKTFKCPLKMIFNCNKEFKRNDKLLLHLATHIRQINISKDLKRLRKRRNNLRSSKASKKDVPINAKDILFCQNGYKIEAFTSVQKNQAELTTHLEGSESSRVFLSGKKNSKEIVLCAENDSKCTIYQEMETSLNEKTTLDALDPDYIISYDPIEEDIAMEPNKEVEVLYFPFLSTNILEPTVENVGSSSGDLPCVLEIQDQSYAYLESESQTISESETLFEESDLIRIVST